MENDAKKLIVSALRENYRGKDVLYHGTRYARLIFRHNAFHYPDVGDPAVCFTRSPEVAAYWSLVPRDGVRKEVDVATVFVIDRAKLRTRFKIELHDDFAPASWSPSKDEMEERVYADIKPLWQFLLGFVAFSEGNAVNLTV